MVCGCNFHNFRPLLKSSHGPFAVRVPASTSVLTHGRLEAFCFSASFLACAAVFPDKKVPCLNVLPKELLEDHVVPDLGYANCIELRWIAFQVTGQRASFI